MSVWGIGRLFRFFTGVDHRQRWFHATRGNERYSIELAETRIRFTRDTGARESFGGNDMPYPRFLRSQKWQAHVRDIFGERVLERCSRPRASAS